MKNAIRVDPGTMEMMRDLYERWNNDEEGRLPTNSRKRRMKRRPLSYTTILRRIVYAVFRSGLTLNMLETILTVDKKETLEEFPA